MAIDTLGANREHVLLRRKIEALTIGERLEIGESYVARENNKHFHVRLASGTHIDIYARRVSHRLIDEVTTLMSLQVKDVRS